jgi:uncharacterized protein (TIGR03083 family)
MTASSASDVTITDAIEAERLELADLLSTLPSSAWDEPSLCAGWRVREVVAHMTMPFRYSTAKFLIELMRDRGRFHRMSDRCAKRDAAAPPDELLAALRDNAAYPWKPPGGGFEGALVHDVIHGMDITVALHSDRRVPLDRVRLVLDVIARPKVLRNFETDLFGVELRADDLDWTLGSGLPVTGAAQDLALALCGRKLPAGRLHGDLSSRFIAA